MSNSGKSVGFGSIAALIILVVIALNVFGDKNIEIGKSTVKREKLENQASAQTDYYTDGLGWVKAPSDLEEDEGFYNKTGVQPYLYLTDEVNGSHYPNGPSLKLSAGRNTASFLTMRSICWWCLWNMTTNIRCSASAERKLKASWTRKRRAFLMIILKSIIPVSGIVLKAFSCF